MSQESFSMHVSIIVILLASALSQFAKGNEYEKAKSVALINQPNNSTIEIGENVDFTCKLNATNFNCSWFRNGDLITDIPATLIKTNKNKVTSCVLGIKNATLNDDGVYSCSFISKSNPDFNITSEAAHLTVLRIPDEPSIEYEDLVGAAPQILDIMDESDRNFQCISKNGKPPAELKWFLNETEINGNYSTKPLDGHEHLKIALNRFRLRSEISKNIGKMHILECIATYEPLNLTQTTHIHLKFPTPTLTAYAHIDVKKTESNSSMVYHPNEIKIHCSADGNPVPNFYWEKLSHEGKWINVGNTSEIKSTNGTYRCAARNKYSKIVFSPNITVNITVEHHDDHNSMYSATTIAVTILLMLTFIIVTIFGGYMYQKKCCNQKKKQSEYELVTQFTNNKTILAIEKE